MNLPHSCHSTGLTDEQTSFTHKDVIYWDNNATTPVAEEVFDAMVPFLRGMYTNPSAGYSCAREVRRAVDNAREEVALLVGASPGEIIFTSGATESINTVLRGMARMSPGKKLLCVASDHAAVLQTVRGLGIEGMCLPIECPVDAQGLMVNDAWNTAMLDDLAGASLTWANNETGVIQDVSSFTAKANQAGIPVHVDGVQALGKIAIDVRGAGVDYASFSAHKLHGPKGTGALYVRSGVRLPIFAYGGDQEDGRRAGTENVAGIVGFGAAARLARQSLAEHAEWMKTKRDRFEQLLCQSLDGVHVLSASACRIPNTSNIRFDGCLAQSLSLLLEPGGLICSAGSACKTASPKPSHVLTAMGLSDGEARTCLRFSLSYLTTDDEVTAAATLVTDAVRKVRSVQSSKTGPVTVYRP